MSKRFDVLRQKRWNNKLKKIRINLKQVQQEMEIFARWLGF